MSCGDKNTKDEHFIPKMYLSQFSEVKKDKAFIWAFDTIKMKQLPVSNVKSFCYEKDLYELRSEDNSIIVQNMIEKTFGRIESKMGKTIKRIKAKSQNKDCLQCRAILSEEDKSYLIIFMAALKFRDPKTIESGITILHRTNPNMDERDARNFTLMNLLPLGIDSEWDKNVIIKSAISNYCGMAFQIGFTTDDIIITSDRPIIEWPPSDNELFDRPRAVVFPLTSRLVLYLFPIEKVNPEGRNCFFELSKEQIKDIQTNVSFYANRWVFSRNPLNEEQLVLVKEARNRLLR